MKERFVLRDGIPRSGWVFAGPSVDHEVANFTCENCKFPHVRYVHELKHKKLKQTVKVGCVCAQHLTQDFATPRLRETALKNHAGRRMRWPTLNWKLSNAGNLYLKKKGTIFVVTSSAGRWRASYKLDGNDSWIRVKQWYDTPEEAKVGAFDAMYKVD